MKKNYYLISKNNIKNDHQFFFDKFDNIGWSFINAIVISIILTIVFVSIDFFTIKISPGNKFYPIYYMRGQIILLMIFIVFKLIKGKNINLYSLGLSPHLSKEAKSFLIVFSLFLSIIIVLFCILTFRNFSFDELYHKSVHYYLIDAIAQKNIPLIGYFLLPHLIIVLILSPGGPGNNSPVMPRKRGPRKARAGCLPTCRPPET